MAWQGMTRSLAAAVAAVGVASGAAVAQEAAKVPDTDPAPASAPYDPLESLNRLTSEFNRIVRGAIIDPVVDVYQTIMPEPLQRGIANAASNLSEPVTAASSLLQGDTENAANSTKRFLLNTTAGLGGTLDPAREQYGIEQRREDLGQAMGKDGVEPGAHIVLPILGPTNTRDAIGHAITGFANPLGLIGTAATSAVEYSGKQEDIKAATEGALDPYVVERDAYEQRRRYEILNQTPDGKPGEDFPALE